MLMQRELLVVGFSMTDENVRAAAPSLPRRRRRPFSSEPPPFSSAPPPLSPVPTPLSTAAPPRCRARCRARCCHAAAALPPRCRPCP
eukprot:2470473-Prymnesium_polylepis.1